VKTEAGNVIQNPFLAIANKCLLQMAQIENDAADAVTRGTSATEPTAKADEQAGNYDYDPAHRHFGEGNWEAG
jgi:hypothetical protein